jgi:hypothetical protein
MRPALPEKLRSLLLFDGAEGRTASDFNPVMSTLPPAKPVIAVDLTESASSYARRAMFCGQSAEEGSHEEFEACGNEIDKLPAPRTPSLEQLPRFPCGPDKRPLVAGGFKAATTDPAQIARFGRHNSRIACGEFRRVASAASMFSTLIPRDLGGSRRTATAFQPLVYIARRGAVCISSSSTHRVCAARGDELRRESMSARMEAM